MKYNTYRGFIFKVRLTVLDDMYIYMYVKNEF